MKDTRRRYPQLQDREWLEKAIKEFTQPEIAEMIGCHRDSVGNALRRLGITGPRRGGKPIRISTHMGERFGLLVVQRVLTREELPSWGSGAWVETRCDCGGTKHISLAHLIAKVSGWDHCGCLTAERNREVGRQRRRVRIREVTASGYRTVTLDDGMVMKEHRWVMEQMLGRSLLPDETVHHINGIRDDNRPDNLELWSSRQPKGQRVADKIAWALEILATYGSDFAA